MASILSQPQFVNSLYIVYRWHSDVNLFGVKQILWPVLACFEVDSSTKMSVKFDSDYKIQIQIQNGFIASHQT